MWFLAAHLTVLIYQGAAVYSLTYNHPQSNLCQKVEFMVVVTQSARCKAATTCLQGVQIRAEREFRICL